jgi:phage terminase small subunit
VPPIKKYADLSPKKRKFVDLYIKCGNVADAVFAAGFKSDCDRTDKRQRQLADNLGRRMLKDPLVHNYIVMNKPMPVSVEGVVDEPLIVEMMTLILTGKTSRMAVSKDGRQLVIEPTFKDSCEAAKVLVQLKKMQDKHVPVEQRSTAVSKRMDQLIASLQSDYTEESDDEG